MTPLHRLRPDWRGYVIPFFALVAIANGYMSGYNRMRVELREEKAQADVEQKVLEKMECETSADGQ